jgi:ligand-binding sensor domain-containing protein
MKKYFALFIFGNILFVSAICQDNWKIYNTTNTGDNGIIGGFIYCFHNDHNNTLWIGSAYGISQIRGSNWSTITSIDGLRVDEVGDITQDKNNNIWISYGSYVAGVTMFDGENFTHFNESNGLVHNKVNDILVDESGNIWFATNGGISMFDGITWTNYTTANGLPDKSIYCLAQDKNGYILIGTSGAGTFMVQDNMIIPFSWEPNSDDYIKDIFVDNLGNIWVAAGTRTYKYSNDWDVIDPFEPGVFGLVWDIDGDEFGKVFFSTSKGFTILDGGIFLYFDVEDNLPHNNVFCSYSINDSIWVGTENGAAIYNNGVWTIINTDDNGLICNDVNSVFEDDSNLWFCTQYGISKFNGLTWQNYKYTDSGKEIKWISKGLQDKNGDYWFGTVNGIYKYDSTNWEVFDYEVNDIFSGWIFDILEDSSGNLWFAGLNYLLKYNGSDWTHYDETEGFQSQYLEALFEDSFGRLWIGSRAGISVYKNQEFQHFISGVDFDSTYSIYGFTEDNNGEIYAIGDNIILIYEENEWETFHSGYWFHGGVCDSTNQLWVATIRNGLLKYDGEEWSNYTIADGMSSNIVNSIYRANNEIFYACTNQGITEFTVKSSNSINESISVDLLFCKIYPNPSKGPLTLSFMERYEFISIEIYNQLGQKLSRKEFNDSNKIDMVLNDPKGVYYLKINTSKGNKGVFKVLKK